MSKRLRFLFGYKYLLNINTREIHSLKHTHINCCLPSISNEHKKYLTEKGMLKLIKGQPDSGTFRYNGCYWCLKKYNTDNLRTVKLKKP